MLTALAALALLVPSGPDLKIERLMIGTVEGKQIALHDVLGHVVRRVPIDQMGFDDFVPTPRSRILYLEYVGEDNLTYDVRWPKGLSEPACVMAGHMAKDHGIRAYAFEVPSDRSPFKFSIRFQGRRQTKVAVLPISTGSKAVSGFRLHSLGKPEADMLDPGETATMFADVILPEPPEAKHRFDIYAVGRSFRTQPQWSQLGPPKICEECIAGASEAEKQAARHEFDKWNKNMVRAFWPTLDPKTVMSFEVWSSPLTWVDVKTPPMDPVRK